VWFGRVHDIGQRRNDLLERWIAVDGVFPDLKCVGPKVHLGVRIAVENPCLLGEEIANSLIVLVVLKECFIGADDLGVFLQALADMGAQANDAFDTIGRQERVTLNDFRLLSNAVDTTNALHQVNDGSGQVIVHDNPPVL
jgi:hypothetical protein